MQIFYKKVLTSKILSIICIYINGDIAVDHTGSGALG